MSAGDVVCTGWLIKSPPEKKLKRFAWRKRWFVLRRGRMSGNPDVLEYYQSKNSKKPIRTIDLKECEVEILDGQLRIKRDFHGKHLFVVKTSSRIFYLVAKTEEEMKVWINNISQICHFETLEDAESSEDGFPHTPNSLQPSPDGSVVSQVDNTYPPDYLFLSQCKTGSVSISRQESFNSDYSLEQRSSEDTHRDIVPSPLYSDSSSSLSYPSASPCVFSHCRLSHPPFSAPCPSMVLPCSSSSPLRRHCAASVFQFDTAFDAATERLTPPPLPPKPCNVPEQPSEKGLQRPQALSSRHISSHCALFSRRTSVSSLDHFRPGDLESRMLRDRRQSLNLPLNTTRVQTYQEESYVPMSSPTVAVSNTDGDGYIPMSPRACGETESPPNLSSLMSQLGEIAPPPINRHLKPRLRRARPPPLDLRGLSTITECPTHLALNRTMTDTCFMANGDITQAEDTGCTNESRHSFFHSIDSTVLPPARKCNLDYLSLDFNSASPSPVQKKPFLSDEHRVDYVQVDEKKTQALQSTKMEWTDTRQSKT
ncbi:hypothetical protein NQD34_010565 [Periophthalmus magnuspinnatus]|nr:GRB2-associated-binding protein 3 isoform X1 [Periophthalmus magnuspinnatus]KAJ0004351.1 hypothetical protein NQD34_010565 [Periophthalmus magnuspinnatus]